jgi:uncharacterized repeat protein (TIGR01451 family)
MLPLWALIFAIAADQAPRPGAPDFSTSSIAVEPAQPVEGDIVTLTLTVRNSGGETATNTEIDLQLPRAGMFVDAGSSGDVSVDLDARVVSWQAGIDAGATRTYAVRLILPRDAGGEVLLPTMRVRQLYTGTEAWIHGEADVQTRIDPSRHGALGIQVAPAGLALLALMVVALGTWALLRILAPRGTRTSVRIGAAVVAMTIAVGFWMIFASLAWRDWRTLSDFTETQCTVLDRRMRISTTPSTTGRQLPQRTTTTTMTTYRPLVAVQYIVDGSPTISTGFDTGSRVQIGSGARELESFERWRVGDNVPCWYNPRSPEDVIVIRGFGGAYLFALFPLPLLLFGLWQIRKVFGPA